MSGKQVSNFETEFFASAQVQAENSNGLLLAYEPGYSEHPNMGISINPENAKVKGKKLGLDAKLMLARKIDKRFKNLPDAVENYNQRTGTMDNAGEILESGQNLFFAGDHEDIFDVPLGLVAYSAFYDKKGIQHRTAMIASKAIDYLGVNLEAIAETPAEQAELEVLLELVGIKINTDNTVLARSLLGLAADETFFTIPATKSFERLRRHEAFEVSAYNRAVILHIKSYLSRGGIINKPPVLIKYAAPGTVNKLLNEDKLSSEQAEWLETIRQGEDDRRVEVIGRPSWGITDFANQGITYPEVIRLAEKPKLAMAEHGFCISNKESVGRLGAALVELASKVDTEYLVVLDNDQELPTVRKLTQKRII